MCKRKDRKGIRMKWKAHGAGAAAAKGGEQTKKAGESGKRTERHVLQRWNKNLNCSASVFPFAFVLTLQCAARPTREIKL